MKKKEKNCVELQCLFRSRKKNRWFKIHTWVYVVCAYECREEEKSSKEWIKRNRRVFSTKYWLSRDGKTMKLLRPFLHDFVVNK